MTESQRIAFGKNIKHLLIDKDVSQRDLADAAGVSEHMISKVISGAKKPPFDVVVAIANKLGVTVDELIKT